MPRFFHKARPKLPVTLTKEQPRELKRLIQAPATPQKLVLRARIVLQAAAGETNQAIAKALATSLVAVGLWRQRFIDLGLAGLAETPRPGRPPAVDPAKARRVITEVVQPPKHARRWSCRTMAKQVGLSKDTVRRIWGANGLKPHRTRTFKLSQDPAFEAKFWDVIGLYLNPPVQAVGLGCDEKSQCQALERTQPGLPLKQGHMATHTHDYYRHGTITLLAALNYLNGKIISTTARRQWLST